MCIPLLRSGAGLGVLGRGGLEPSLWGYPMDIPHTFIHLLGIFHVSLCLHGGRSLWRFSLPSAVPLPPSLACACREMAAQRSLTSAVQKRTSSMNAKRCGCTVFPSTCPPACLPSRANPACLPACLPSSLYAYKACLPGRLVASPAGAVSGLGCHFPACQSACQLDHGFSHFCHLNSFLSHSVHAVWLSEAVMRALPCRWRGQGGDEGTSLPVEGTRRLSRCGGPVGVNCRRLALRLSIQQGSVVVRYLCSWMTASRACVDHLVTWRK